MLVTDGPRVAAIVPDAPADVALDDCTLVPGFVDAHCHGGGGASFSADPGAVLALHRAQHDELGGVPGEPVAGHA